MKTSAVNAFLLIGFYTAIGAFLPTEAKADLVCRLCPFSCADTGAEDRDCGDKIQRRNGKCCVDLDNRGLDALRELDRRHSGSGYNYGYGYGNSSHDENEHGRYYQGWQGSGWYGTDRDGGYNQGGRNRSDNYGAYIQSQRNDPPRYDTRRNDPGAYDDRTGYHPGDCPTGYHVNDRGCNNDERGKGCRDQRSPSGQTCVGWFRR